MIALFLLYYILFIIHVNLISFTDDYHYLFVYFAWLKACTHTHIYTFLLLLLLLLLYVYFLWSLCF